MSLALLLAVAPGVSHALPDLTPEIYAVFLDADATVGAGDVTEGCAGATSGRTLLRFGVRSLNVGATALHTGDPGCPDCMTNPGAVCANPLFECSPADGHNHPHFTDFGRYELFDAAGTPVATGGKRSFCMLDTACPGGGTRVYTDCQDQGISPGCYDEYAPTLGCQYIDVTDVPDVTTRAFRLRVTLDPDDLLPDVDRTNNAVEVALPGCGDGIVQEGEECDACQVGRIATATSGLACPARLMRRVGRRVDRLDEMATRLSTASPAGTARLEKRLVRRASRLVHVLDGAAQRGRCATEVAATEVRRLRDQLAGA